MNAALCFIDCETTGLDPDDHEIWEVAIRLIYPDLTTADHVWQLDVDAGRADPIAMKIGQFYERRLERFPTNADGTDPAGLDPIASNSPYVVPPSAMWIWAEQFARLTWGTHLIGAVPSFDEERLRRLIRRLGACHGWHYHLIDVETLAVGYLMGRAKERSDSLPGLSSIDGAIMDIALPPWNSEHLSSVTGVDPAQFDRHTALGDVQWAEAIYSTIMVP